jgi:hypothetical protein
MPAVPVDVDRLPPEELSQPRVGCEADLQALLKIRVEGLRGVDIEEELLMGSSLMRAMNSLA